jgi:TonB family protein
MFMEKQTNRIIFKKPKKIKQYTVYAMLVHVIIILIIMIALWHAFHPKHKTPFISATIVSSIPKQKATQKLEPVKQSPSQLEKHLRQQQLQREATELNQDTYKIQQAARSRLIDQAKQKILQQIGAFWIVPKQANAHLSTQVLITLDSNGKVLLVKMLKSSGLPILDQSAIYAIKKSSPLPMPTDPSLLNSFKQLRLTLRPEKIVHI